MKRLQQSIAIAGTAAVLIMTSGSLITALNYRGLKGEQYSILNHFISELGQIGVSRLAPFFNVCLMISGLLIAAFMIGLGVYIKRPWGYVVSLLGAISGVSCSLVGVFPMNHMTSHVRVADGFFYGILATIFLFTVCISLDKNADFSRWMTLPGGLVVVCVLSFIIVPRFTNTNHIFTLNPARVIRPHFWPNAFLEWTVFFSVLIWIVSMSVYLIRGAGTLGEDVTTAEDSRSRGRAA